MNYFYEEEFNDNGKDAAIYILDKRKFIKDNDEELLAELIYKYNEWDATAIELEGRTASYPLEPTYYECPDDYKENNYTGKKNRIGKQEGCFILFPHAFEEDKLSIPEGDIYKKIIIPNEFKRQIYDEHNKKYKLIDYK